MTDKKFTQKDIIKALEICTNGKLGNEDCINCPYESGIRLCSDYLMLDALDLINRLKTRIVRYQLKNTNQRNALASLNKKVAEQKVEIERLNKKLDESLELATDFEADLNNRDAEIKDLKAEIEMNKNRAKDFVKKLGYVHSMCDSLDEAFTKAKTEAIKEFAKRLKETVPHFVDGYTTMECVERAIQYLVKEMTEVNNESAS